MLPSMKYADRITKTQQIKFGGLDMTVGAKDGALRAMRNLSSDHAPVLATRAPRYLCREMDKPGGLYAWDGLCWVSGTDFWYDGKIRGQVSEGEKSIVTMGPYIIIFPDKCYFHVDTGEFGSLESRWEGKNLTFCDGQIYEETAKANTIKCEGVNWTDWFRDGDGVTISGCATNPGNNKDAVIREIDGDELRFDENVFTLGTESGTVSIARTVPDMKFLCENENRLWGCTDTTIYISKWSDPFNWNVQDGLETDSYVLEPGSAGTFTGCISYRGYPTFFKEDHIYKVYGSVPSNYEVLGSASLGLAEGCHGSLAIAGETLFYLSTSGIMAYTGGIPQPMGAAFGINRFLKAVGGSDGLKYYVSMQEADKSWSLYVYDTQTGLWHREDETKAVGFARHKGDLYMLNVAGQLWILGHPQNPPEDAVQEDAFSWEAEFADFTENEPNRKALSKLQLRVELEPGATVQAWLQFDSDGVWHKVRGALGEGTKRSYYLPIIPRRADHYRLKLTGTGGCRVYSLSREFYVGSELKTRY